MSQEDLEQKLYNLRKFRADDNIEPNPYYFRDGIRKIHYIIAIRDRAIYIKEMLRYILEYLNYLELQGLETEFEIGIMDPRLVYLKVHASDEVIRKFAILYDIDLENAGHDFIIPDNFFRMRFTTTELTQHYNDVFKREGKNISSRERVLLLHKILSDPIASDDREVHGIEKLIQFGYIKDAFPLHDGEWEWTNIRNQAQLNDRQILVKYWASLSMWYKEQPINLIEKYFGTEIAFYFAWFEHYTHMLIVVAIVEIVFILINIIILESAPQNFSKSVCKSKSYICPMCQERMCQFVPLSNYCSTTRAEFVLGNYMNLIYAIFISIWVTVFLESWIRKECTLRVRWRVQQSDIDYKLRYDYKDKATYMKKSKITGNIEHYYPIGNRILRYSFTYFINFLVVLVVSSNVIFLILIKHGCLMLMNPENEPMSTLIATVLYSTCQVIFIKIFSMFYIPLSEWLTRQEIPKTEKEYSTSVIYKIYIFGFINNYIPILYTAFLRGQVFTLPAQETMTYIFELDSCFPTGCIIVLAIQLFFVMALKNFGGNLFSAYWRKIKQFWYNILQTKKIKETEMYIPTWENEYYLEKYDETLVSREICEIVIQFGYVCFFMAAFPLVGVLAILNNLLEIRTDAMKLVKDTRRPVPKMVRGFGAWDNILRFASYFSIICNGFIVAFNTNSIQTVVYAIYGKHEEFTDFLFSKYAVKDLPPKFQNNRHNITECIYHGYRYPPGHEYQYQRTDEDYLVHLWKYVFVIIFENLILMIIHTIYYFVDEMPRRVKQQLHREQLNMKKVKMKLLEEEIRKGN